MKFHRFWNDVLAEKARLVFISEYMTSGSLKKFLKKTRTNNKTISAKVMFLSFFKLCLMSIVASALDVHNGYKALAMLNLIDRQIEIYDTTGLLLLSEFQHKSEY